MIQTINGKNPIKICHCPEAKKNASHGHPITTLHEKTGILIYTCKSRNFFVGMNGVLDKSLHVTEKKATKGAA